MVSVLKLGHWEALSSLLSSRTLLLSAPSLLPLAGSHYRKGFEKHLDVGEDTGVVAAWIWGEAVIPGLASRWHYKFISAVGD